ncbi:MAG TPA: methyltransferase domain-containing protein [Puia sp.]|uniref:class I SAM-dependent methyltransferase n=1 Tax=Puia sp. TaxID=2045100 RepID=UPI002BB7AC87|nr:methyltransferase domain-containing protein [Puia sp.]HVU94618.1 methyltransferase domain-containing protein [Puia sp.]
MGNVFIHREFGRQAFGDDPARYHAARPAYPDWVFERLRERCGVGPGIAGFEVGAGTGIATRRLLEMGIDPLLAIEPDERMAGFLRESFGFGAPGVAGEPAVATGAETGALHVLCSTFEDAVLPEGGFRFGVSATAFHWVEEGPGLERVARLLSPGGWWAVMWNVFGDLDRVDPFHEATKELLDGYTNVSMLGGVPYALDTAARSRALEQAGAFDIIECEHRPWALHLDTEAAVALYSTYSNIQVRPDRDAVLVELRRIVREEFGGRITRNMVTSLYLARRR